MDIIDFTRKLMEIEPQSDYYLKILGEDFIDQKKYTEQIDLAITLHWISYRHKHIFDNYLDYPKTVKNIAKPNSATEYYYDLLNNGYIEYDNLKVFVNYLTKKELVDFHNKKIKEFNEKEKSAYNNLYDHLSESEKIELLISHLKRDELREILNLKGYSKKRLLSLVYQRLSYEFFKVNYKDILSNKENFNQFILDRTTKNEMIYKTKRPEIFMSNDKKTIVDYILNNYEDHEIDQEFKIKRPVRLTKMGEETLIDGFFYLTTDIFYYETFLNIPTEIFTEYFYGFNKKFKPIVEKRHNKFKRNIRNNNKKFVTLPLEEQMSYINFFRQKENYEQSSKYVSLLAEKYSMNDKKIISHYFFLLSLTDYINYTYLPYLDENLINNPPSHLVNNIDKYDKSIFNIILKVCYIDWYKQQSSNTSRVKYELISLFEDDHPEFSFNKYSKLNYLDENEIKKIRENLYFNIDKNIEIASNIKIENV